MSDCYLCKKLGGGGEWNQAHGLTIQGGLWRPPKSLHTETCSEMTPGSIRNVWLQFLVKGVFDRFLCNSRSPAAQQIILLMKAIASLTFKKI